jgi:riboflavin synthase
MFTGLVEAKGVLVRRTDRGREARLVLRGDLVDAPSLSGAGAREPEVRRGAAAGREPIVLGESIAIDGVCLTVDAILEPGGGSETVFEVDASSETLERTTLGKLAPGAAVNLERALRLGARLGGHIVSGHVDGIGRVSSVTPIGKATKIVFEAPADLVRYIASKGSICVNGVSLTVNGTEGACFDVMIIPHTQERTSLGALAPGAPVNLEVDLLARYVARLLETSAPREQAQPADDGRLLERLRAAGYV